MTHVSLAAWLIIGYIGGKLISVWRKEKAEHLERLAVTYEYKDGATTEERRQRLLMSYPQYLVHPESKYWDMARAEVQAGKTTPKERRQFIKDAAIAALCWAGLLALAIVGFAVYLSHAPGDMPEPFGDALRDACLIILGYALEHLSAVLTWAVIVVWISALVLRVLIGEDVA